MTPLAPYVGETRSSSKPASGSLAFEPPSML
jgi:hypothetical protein